MTVRIAVDAMGGDHAPTAIFDGVSSFLQEQDDVRITMVGPQDVVSQRLESWPEALRSHVEVRHAPDVITAEESAAQAYRRKPESTIAVGLNLVRDGEADAFVSAGSTGALMAGSFLAWGRIAGVRRPAIGSLISGFSGRGFYMLDLGAHMGASANDLLQYGIMGSVYAEEVLGWQRPRIGLLNVGTEEGKGTETTKEAFQLLSKAPINFVGNVEGRDIFRGAADVVVCDGFVGNTVLKALEGFSDLLFATLRDELNASLRAKLGGALLLPSFKSLAKRLDYRETGGAPLLGVDGICVKCHGSSNGRAIRHGLMVAREAVLHRVVDQIRNCIGEAGAPDA